MAAQQAPSGYAAPPQTSAGFDQGTGYLPPPANTGPGPAPAYGTGPIAPQPTPTSNRLKYVLTALATVVVVFVGLAIIGSITGGDNDGDVAQPGDDADVDTLTGPTDDGDSSTTTSSSTSTSTTTTTEAIPTAPPRSPLLADLPELPVNEQPYERYRTVSDSGRSFIVEVPNEWVDELPTEGQVIVSPDNNAALAEATISGGVVSGSQGIGIWDPEFFLNSLIEQNEGDDNPCSEVTRKVYDDGVFDGLLYAEYCNGGDLLVVTVLASDPNRDTVFLVASQMTDERDMAAFQRMLDSFLLLDVSALPAVE